MQRKSVLKRLVTVASVVLASAVIFYGCNNPANDNRRDDVASKENLDKGHDALAARDFDAAIAFYEAAYRANNNNSEAILYSSLARLAGISIDPKMREFFIERVGFTEYPNRLNALLSTDWLVVTPNYYLIWDYFDDELDGWVYWHDWRDIEWYDLDRVGYYYTEWDFETWTPTYHFVSDEPRYEQYGSIPLPGLSDIDWVGGAGTLYNSMLVNNLPTVETWAVLLFANLIDKNPAGLNNLLDGLHAAVFGASFNEIVTRVERLKGKPPVTLSGDFLKSIGLGHIYDELDPIGWAEANVVVSFMTAIKASLEWVSAYNWDTDLNILRFAWPDNPSDFEMEVYNRLRDTDVDNLPFGNDFLKPRPGRMDRAKASFITAIDGLIASYDAFLADSRYPTVVNDFATLRLGAIQLRGAIENGGLFYIPDDPTRGSWPNSGDAINMGALFEPGFFSLQNLFEVDASGMPVFYADGERLTFDNYRELIAENGGAALKFRTAHLEELIQFDSFEPYGYEYIDFPNVYARLLIEKFNGWDMTARSAKRPEPRIARSVDRR